MTYQLHPLCTLFPRIEGAEFKALCADIRANGLRESIVLHDGMILDGGNRYRACIDSGTAPQFVQFDGADIVAFVLSANLHRRHLSAGQHAAIVASVTNWAAAYRHGGDRKSEQAVMLPLESVADRMAVSGASDKTQRVADKVGKADPELVKLVGQGKTTLAKAAAQVGVAPRKPAPPKAKTARELEAERLDEEAFGGLDPLETLKTENAELEAENRELRGLVDAAQAEDQKAETLKWRRMYDNAVRQQSDAMNKAKLAQDREAWSARQLSRCGKAVGETDPSKIAATVEGLMRARVAA